jgi:hypothetical protein
MESDVRTSTNERGFCRTHANALYLREHNRLGLGLMLHTRVRKVGGDLGTVLEQADIQPRTLLSGRQKEYRDRLRTAAAGIRGRAETCVICDRLADTMARYLDVVTMANSTRGLLPGCLRAPDISGTSSGDLLDAAAARTSTKRRVGNAGDLRTVTALEFAGWSTIVVWLTLIRLSQQRQALGVQQRRVIREDPDPDGGADPKAGEALMLDGTGRGSTG